MAADHRQVSAIGRSATGSFQAGLIGLFVMTIAMAGLILLLRHRVRGKAMRSAARLPDGEAYFLEAPSS